MPRAYSLDLRERVLAAVHDWHLSQPAVAQRFRVSEGTADTAAMVAFLVSN